MSGRTVGFFDSGAGGLCIRDAFLRLCPSAKTVYIADAENCPYGNKSADEIIRLSRRNTRRLLDAGCDIVVVACNTATAAAIDILRKEFPGTPFVGIEPAVKPAALVSKTGVVGVLATAGTFNGRLYRETKAKFAKDVSVLATVADEFVEIVESMVEGSGEAMRVKALEELPEARRVEIERAVRRRIEPLLSAGADVIVLGCTHFPHLKAAMERVAAGRAAIIDPSDAVARQIVRVAAGVQGREKLVDPAGLEPTTRRL